METNIKLEANIVSERRNTKKQTISLASILVGALLITIAVLFVPEKSAPLYLLMLTVGVIMVICFGIKAVVWNKEFIFNATQSPLEQHSFYIKHHALNTLISELQKENISTLDKVYETVNTGMQLDVIYSKDNKFAVCQLFKYVPYHLEAVSELFHIEGDFRPQFCASIETLAKKQQGR